MVLGSALSVTSLAGCGSIIISSGPGPTTTFIPGPSVTIGLLVPLSGPDAALGRAERNGAELAMTQYDAATEQVSVRLQVLNTAGVVSRARSDAQLMVREGVVAVMGPGTDAESNAVDPIFERAGIPQIDVSAAGDELAENGDPSFHRVVASDSEAGADEAEFLVDQGSTSVAVVDDGLSDYSTLLGQLGETLANDAVSSDPITFPSPGVTASSVADEIVDGLTVTDAVVFVGDPTGGDRLVEALRDDDYTGTILLGGGAGDPAAAADAWGLPTTDTSAYLACACDDPGSSASEDLTFVRAYTGAYGVPPPEWSAQASDATNVILHAVISAGTGSGAGVVPGADITAAAVQAALGTLSYAGVSGTISFTAGGDLTSPPVWISTIKDGTVTQQGGDVTVPVSSTGS